MNIKEFDDGSVFTGKHVAFSVIVGGIGAAVLYTGTAKIADWKEKRAIKKLEKNSNKVLTSN
jgi:hypothetical protein